MSIEHQPVERALTVDSAVFDERMTPFEISMVTRGLDPRQLIQFWKTFRSTVHCPCPSRATGKPRDDLAAVLAQSKPAALFLAPDDPEPIDELNRVAVEDGLAKDILTGTVVLDTGFTIVIVGQKINFDGLSALYRQRQYKHNGGIGEEFHRGVGRLLGYTPEAIDSFVSKQ